MDIKLNYYGKEHMWSMDVTKYHSFTIEHPGTYVPHEGPRKKSTITLITGISKRHKDVFTLPGSFNVKLFFTELIVLNHFAKNDINTSDKIFNTAFKYIKQTDIPGIFEVKI